MVFTDGSIYIQGIRSEDHTQVFSALKSIKNSIIGNIPRKKYYCLNLDILPFMIQLLKNAENPLETRINSAEIIASLLHCIKFTILSTIRRECYEYAKKLSSPDVYDTLVQILAKEPSIKLKEVVVRAIKAVVTHDSSYFKVEENLDKLYACLSTDFENFISMESMSCLEQRIIRNSLIIIEKLCNSYERQVFLVNRMVIYHIINVVDVTYEKVVISALNTLSAILSENPKLIETLNSGPYGKCVIGKIDRFLDIAKSDNKDLQIAACKLLARVSRVWDSDLDIHKIAISVIPVVSSLINNTNKDQLAAVETLGLLCHGNKEMQKVVGSAKLIRGLISAIGLAETNQESEFLDTEYFINLHQMLLFAVGEIVSNNEMNRNAASDEGIIKYIEKGMKHMMEKLTYGRLEKYVTSEDEDVQEQADIGSPEIKVACLLLFINLTSNDSGIDDGAFERMEKLKRLGVDKVVAKLQSAASLDVKDKAMVVLQQLNSE
ncbi:hypothetical protein BB559_004426 [Furculomyces boomerangus]|uniref:UNC-45/Cro1/She4 central domain-containing protein n=1 Tax=Furculomyces boomerangus TaxID=61424 RepID=A0A2T9YER9_9FUNG|nr:hypothetical protein BB559_004426 [Furculomyces boomerangus]